MKELFSLHTVRKKILMLSKLAGVVLIFSYIFSARLPISADASFLVWLGFVFLLIIGIDLFMDRFITKPVDTLNASAKRMADLDFSAPCGLSSADEFGELSASLNTMAENLQQAQTPSLKRTWKKNGFCWPSARNWWTAYPMK